MRFSLRSDPTLDGARVWGTAPPGVRQDGDRGDGTLVVLEEGEEVGRVVHTGKLTFRNPKLPGVREWFLLDGETAGWWAYEVDGFLMEVNRRVPPPQPAR